MTCPFLRNRSEKPSNGRDHEPISVLANSVGFDLFGAVHATTPLATEGEVATEACTAELRRNRFAMLDGGHDLISGRPALGHAIGGVWVDSHGHGASSYSEYS